MLGLRRLDGHHLGRVQESTHRRYRQVVGTFATWLLQNGYTPNTPVEFDDLLMEFKVDTNARKASFENLIAAIEFVLPGRVKLVQMADRLVICMFRSMFGTTEYLPVKARTFIVTYPLALSMQHWAVNLRCPHSMAGSI